MCIIKHLINPQNSKYTNIYNHRGARVDDFFISVIFHRMNRNHILCFLRQIIPYPHNS